MYVERPLPLELIAARQELASLLIQGIVGWWASHEKHCPVREGGDCRCGYVICFSNKRALVAVAPNGGLDMDWLH